MATVTISNDNLYAVEIDLYRQYENKIIEGKAQATDSANTLEIDVSPVIWYDTASQVAYYTDTYGSLPGVTVTSDVPASGTTDAKFTIAGYGDGKEVSITVGSGADESKKTGITTGTATLNVKTGKALAISVADNSSTPKTFTGSHTFVGNDVLFINLV